MAAITIRNLADEVVDALKERARRNGRSMEAETRDILTRLAAGDAASGLERTAAAHAPRRRSTPWGEIAQRIRDSPPPPLDDAWGQELYESRDDDPADDPWEGRAAP